MNFLHRPFHSLTITFLISLSVVSAPRAQTPSRDLLIDRLLELADDPDPRVRFQTALTLGGVETPRRIEALAKISRRDCADRWVRTAILTAVSHDADNLLADLMADAAAPADGLASLAEGLGSVIGARGESGEIASIVQIASENGAAANEPLVVAALEGIVSGLKLNEGKKIPIPEAALALTRLQAAPFSSELRANAAKLAAFVKTADTGAHAGRVSDLLRAATKAENESRPDADRLTLLNSLARSTADSPGDWSALASLLVPSESDEFRMGLLAILRDVDAVEPYQIVLAQFGGFSPAVREKAFEVLFSQRERIALFLNAVESGAIKANKLDAARRAQLLKFPDSAIASRAAALLSPTPESGTFDLYEKHKPALELQGVATRGAEIHKTRCMQCHRAGGVGHDVGPNWAGFKANPPETILLNLLHPSLNILPGFTQYIIELRNGRVAMGIIAASTPSSVILRRGGGEEETILRRNIRSMSDTALSIMPEGLEDGLSHQDIADLLAFIKSVD